MTEKEYLYLLMNTKGLGAVGLHKLYDRFESFRESWMAGEKTLTTSGILKEAQVKAILETKRSETELRREFEELEKRKIRFITFQDADYPKRLKPFRDCPAGLFVRGRLPEDTVPSVAIVGARGCSEYGKDTARGLARELAERGVQIVSGLAVGVDGAAHTGALEAGEGGGGTFGILGCGINICYPKENFRLFSEMAEKGGLMTEFIPGTKPTPGNFIMRNRIISGISDAVIVVEAKEKSGSLLTADYALEQGKEVFAVPGRITDGLSVGCNRLLQMGASLCLGPREILDIFGIKYEEKPIVGKISEKRLAKNEKLVYSCLDSRPRHLEEIVLKCELPVREAMEILLKLELAGVIHGNGNQYYYRKL